MIKLFLDLDGTLAKFNSKRNALQRFDKEENFFSSLKPYKHIEYINSLIKSRKDLEVYIISASPNLNADIDKITWVNEYLSNRDKDHICLCRLGENKAEIIGKKLHRHIGKDCILLDDYTKNLQEWTKQGGTGIKRITSLADNSRGIWQGYCLKDLRKLSLIIAEITAEVLEVSA